MITLQYVSLFLIGFFGYRSYIKDAFSEKRINYYEAIFIYIFLFLFSINLLTISQYLIYLVLLLYFFPIVRLMVIIADDRELTNWGRAQAIIWSTSFLGFLDYYVQANILNNLIQYVKAFVS